MFIERQKAFKCQQKIEKQIYLTLFGVVNIKVERFVTCVFKMILIIIENIPFHALDITSTTNKIQYIDMCSLIRITCCADKEEKKGS